MIEIKNYINGELVDPCNDQWINGYNPATEEKNSLIPSSSKEDINRMNLLITDISNFSRLDAELSRNQMKSFDANYLFS